MDTIVFLLYAVIFACIWYVFNQYFKDHSGELKEPIKINMGGEFQKWKEHFSVGDKIDLSIPNIKKTLQKALNQLTNKNEDSIKPKVTESKIIDTDMELYLIGNDKEAFIEEIKNSRTVPTQVQVNKNNLDLDFYLGTNKKNKTLGSLL